LKHNWQKVKPKQDVLDKVLSQVLKLEAMKAIKSLNAKGQIGDK
jgi:hypothetical protein